jgi:DNA replication and repair protein RecF
LRIRELRAVGWRNLAPLHVVFDPDARLNVLHGDNGQGKTNVLEALYYLARFRSFRTTRVVDLVQRGASEARIEVEVDARDLRRRIEVRLVPGERRDESLGPAHLARSATRTIILDGKPARGVASVFGQVSVVLFVPEDLLLIRAVPSARRRFLDMAIAGLEPAYFQEASAFQKVLRSRNVLLRTGRATSSPALLDTYDEQLAGAGARVVLRRRQLVEALAPDVERNLVALHIDLAVGLSYESDTAVMAAVSESEVASALLAGMARRRGIDERRGYTTFGPQTDDLEIRLGDRPAREHASQGQLRSLVLAMKFAELANVEGRRGEPPVLLLDDVPSELDPTRRLHLFETLGRMSCQTVVSVADPGVLPPLLSRADFRVESGCLTTVPVFALQTGM